MECKFERRDCNSLAKFDEGLLDNKVSSAEKVFNASQESVGIRGDSKLLSFAGDAVKRPAIFPCRSISEFNIMASIGDGTYGVVTQAVDIKTGRVYALKKLKFDEAKEGFPLASLREIRTLAMCNHENIVKLGEIVVDNTCRDVYLVMEYLEHDLQTLMASRDRPWTISEIKCLMKQLMEAVKYLHSLWIFHRDIKPANLLLNNHGQLKLADFGLTREYGSPINAMTPGVVTLWYRAPELLLGMNKYTPAIDIWSCGCIFGELILNKALFRGSNELDQINKIYSILGTPNERIWPGYTDLQRVKNFHLHEQEYSTLKRNLPSLSDYGLDLIKKMLAFDPSKRISAEDALNHPYFEELPLPIDRELMPTHRPKADGKLIKVDMSRYYKETGKLGRFDPPSNEHASMVLDY